MAFVNVSIHLDRAAALPRYRQIAAGIQAAVHRGKLRPGMKLPPARVLATQLKVNPVTVVQAYRVLAAEGWVESRVGSGTYVCERLEDPAPVPADTEEARLPELFPTHTLKRVVDHILATDGARAFGYDDAPGYPPLLESLRAYLRAGGIRPGQDELVIFSGALRHALHRAAPAHDAGCGVRTGRLYGRLDQPGLRQCPDPRLGNAVARPPRRRPASGLAACHQPIQACHSG